MKSLKLGQRHFNSTFVQGPLAGVSCAPFRELVWQYSKPAFTCTEMISAIDLVNRPDQRNRFTYISSQEGPVCFQLAAKDPHILGKATQIVSELGASLVDLNCGCPKNKIRQKGTGSKLLQQPDLIGQCVAAMKANTDLPVSIKIRVDGNAKSQWNLPVVEAAQQHGVDFIVVHGRHWQDDYAAPCHWEQVAQIVRHASVPIIANGDIHSLASYQAVLRATGCQGAMISRASVGKPWLINQIQHEASGERFAVPDIKQQITIFIQHIKQLATLESEHLALLQSRALLKYYFRDCLREPSVLPMLYQAPSLKCLEMKLNHLFA